MTSRDRHRQELAVAIVRGTTVSGPMSTPSDISDAIATGLLSQGVVDVTIEVATASIGGSRHVYAVITGPDAEAAVVALMAAPGHHGLTHATVELHLAQAERANAECSCHRTEPPQLFPPG